MASKETLQSRLGGMGGIGGRKDAKGFEGWRWKETQGRLQ